jgi:predicted kinase
MTELKLTRGLPASGKTVFAKNWVAKNPSMRARVCRDDLRQALYGMDAPLPRELEQGVTLVEKASVRALLASGRSVVVDAMHLRRSYITEWEKLAQELGAEFSVQEFLDLPTGELLRRDRARKEKGERHVGDTFICETAERYATTDSWQPSPGTPVETYRYQPDLSLPKAWMVDLDGTLALMGNGRGPFEWHRVGEDEVNTPVAHLIEALDGDNNCIIIISGRDAVCREETLLWLKRNYIDYDALIMRPEGDNRKDSIVKLEMFREQIVPTYFVMGVIDDRPQVCRAWRQAGLFVAQVGDPYIEF